MKTQVTLFLTIVLLSTLMSSCFTDIIVVGNNETTEEERTITDFKRVSSMGCFNVYYAYASAPSVTVKAESNLLPYIETIVVGSELRISNSFSVSLHPRAPIEVYVYGPYVDQIQLSGSGIISTDTIVGEELSLRVSGSGDIETIFIGDDFEAKISGSGKMFLYAECNNSNIEVSGSGRVKVEGSAISSFYRISGSGKVSAYDFPVENATANISGSGNLYLNVDEEINGFISGSGNIFYIGNPDINCNISGSGRVVNQNSSYN